jgi:hypothetical protein
MTGRSSFREPQVAAVQQVPSSYELDVADVGGVYRLTFMDAARGRRIVLAEDFAAAPAE